MGSDSWETDEFKKIENKKIKILEAALIEQFAEIEHNQWMHYVKVNIERGLVTEEAEKRWLPKLVPYKDLSEEEKEKDRIWARKALAIAKSKKTLMLLKILQERGEI